MTIIPFIVVVFSVVQSIFGMGLLVFGTPTLLLVGKSFSETLGWLLPASVAISLIQVIEGRKHAQTVWINGRPLLCLLPMAVSLACVLHYGFKTKIDGVIGITMIAAAVVRASGGIQRHLSNAIVSAEKTYLTAMGFLHGFTNMGGAMLSIYSLSTNNCKEDIRGTIATYYLCFGLTQILLIVFIKPEALGFHSAAMAVIGATVYITVGRQLFINTSGLLYNQAITGFLAAYGIAVLAKATLQGA